MDDKDLASRPIDGRLRMVVEFSFKESQLKTVSVAACQAAGACLSRFNEGLDDCHA